MAASGQIQLSGERDINVALDSTTTTTTAPTTSSTTQRAKFIPSFPARLVDNVRPHLSRIHTSYPLLSTTSVYMAHITLSYIIRFPFAWSLLLLPLTSLVHSGRTNDLVILHSWRACSSLLIKSLILTSSFLLFLPPGLSLWCIHIISTCQIVFTMYGYCWDGYIISLILAFIPPYIPKDLWVHWGILSPLSSSSSPSSSSSSSSLSSLPSHSSPFLFISDSLSGNSLGYSISLLIQWIRRNEELISEGWIPSACGLIILILIGSSLSILWRIITTHHPFKSHDPTSLSLLTHSLAFPPSSSSSSSSSSSLSSSSSIPICRISLTSSTECILEWSIPSSPSFSTDQEESAHDPVHRFILHMNDQCIGICGPGQRSAILSDLDLRQSAAHHRGSSPPSFTTYNLQVTAIYSSGRHTSSHPHPIPMYVFGRGQDQDRASVSRDHASSPPVRESSPTESIDPLKGKSSTSRSGKEVLNDLFKISSISPEVLEGSMLSVLFNVKNQSIMTDQITPTMESMRLEEEKLDLQAKVRDLREVRRTRMEELKDKWSSWEEKRLVQEEERRSERQLLRECEEKCRRGEMKRVTVEKELRAMQSRCKQVRNTWEARCKERDTLIQTLSKVTKEGEGEGLEWERRIIASDPGLQSQARRIQELKARRDRMQKQVTELRGKLNQGKVQLSRNQEEVKRLESWLMTQEEVWRKERAPLPSQARYEQLMKEKEDVDAKAKQVTQIKLELMHQLAQRPLTLGQVQGHLGFMTEEREKEEEKEKEEEEEKKKEEKVGEGSHEGRGGVIDYEEGQGVSTLLMMGINSRIERTPSISPTSVPSTLNPSPFSSAFTTTPTSPTLPYGMFEGGEDGEEYGDGALGLMSGTFSMGAQPSCRGSSLPQPEIGYYSVPGSSHTTVHHPFPLPMVRGGEKRGGGKERGGVRGYGVGARSSTLPSSTLSPLSGRGMEMGGGGGTYGSMYPMPQVPSPVEYAQSGRMPPDRVASAFGMRSFEYGVTTIGTVGGVERGWDRWGRGRMGQGGKVGEGGYEEEEEEVRGWHEGSVGSKWAGEARETFRHKRGESEGGGGGGGSGVGWT
ncbi:MAG: hypothetical protein DHS80DRAFT_28313 [Piptocephalis tieghemiana]|nr:MAG: hypothetical protein DHS80DRAFT_28313 [Piptocephalis tieghemiana]